MKRTKEAVNLMEQALILLAQAIDQLKESTATAHETKENSDGSSQEVQ